MTGVFPLYLIGFPIVGEHEGHHPHPMIFLTYPPPPIKVYAPPLWCMPPLKNEAYPH